MLALCAMDEFEEQRAALKRFMEERALNSYNWATRAGVPESTLRTYLAGKTNTLKGMVERKLASAEGVTVDALYGRDYAPSRPASRVWVKGDIGAGNTVLNFDAMGENEGFYEVARPPGVPGDLALGAAEIRGGSMPPWRDGDVIYFEVRDHVDLDTVLGEACLVELADGAMVFKEVRQGYEPNTYNLLSWDGRPPMENQRVRRAMPMVSVVRKRRATL